MNIRSRLAILSVALLLPTLLGTGSAGALQGGDLDGADQIVKPIEKPPGVDVCEPMTNKRFVCLDIEGDGHRSMATACLYDETLENVMWWYRALGKTACIETHEWSYLGSPGACVGTGPTGHPTACVGRDIDKDYNYDGRVDETLHCLIWVAGFCQGFYD